MNTTKIFGVEKTTRVAVRKRVLSGAAALTGVSLLVVGCGSGNSEDFPASSIEFIIPYNPGGGADPVGREYADRLSEELGVDVNVTNRPGGDESVGITSLATSDNDGYTLGLGSSGGAVAQPLVSDDVNYTSEDLTPIARLTGSPQGIFVAADSEYETLDDLLEAAGENPGEVDMAVATTMGPPAFEIFQLEEQADVEFSMVTASGGSGEAALEVIGGRLDAVAGSVPGQAGLLEAGELRLLVHTGTEDYLSEIAPDAETYESLGYDIPWNADFTTYAPADLPEEVETRLVEASEKIINSDEWDEWAETQNYLSTVMTGEELNDYLASMEEHAEHSIELGENRGN